MPIRSHVRQGSRALAARSSRRSLVPILIAALFVGILPALPARAEAVSPQLRMRSGTDLVKAFRVKGQPIYADLGIWVSAEGAPFEVWVTRPDYTQPLKVQQVLYGDTGLREYHDLPADIMDDWNGIKDFIQLDISKDGDLKKTKMMSFCPNSYDRQRVSDNGPDRPSYPDGCFGNPFTKGLVWGIDDGWAVNPASYTGGVLRLQDGLYDVKMSVAERYIDLFNIDPALATASIQLKVKTVRGYPGCPKCPRPPRDRRGHGGHAGWSAARSSSSGTPTMTDPDPSVLPDLIALPSWGITVQNGMNHERINFGATVWSAGASPMVVEGFRRENEDVMDGYQYFYQDDKPVGRAPVGTLEYDPRRGHQHWHFLQFAKYSLLDETMTEVIVSKKEAFCLAPTDAIDLTLPNAEWAPGLTGLNTACGGPGALWVREILPLGWGDTYFQGLPGQSFEITDLPNGTYYIKTEANPLHSLYEQDTSNNSEVRQVIIKGRPGARTVEVPPWNGIDTEVGIGRGREGGGCCG
ncbi:MAG: hypothetical protein QOG54_2323 [Actinomycetota bacterium]|nr:hypothetical protein [Actinomycetota bacterium]